MESKTTQKVTQTSQLFLFQKEIVLVEREKSPWQGSGEEEQEQIQEKVLILTGKSWSHQLRLFQLSSFWELPLHEAVQENTNRNEPDLRV
jgi:hypothetical protein